jgi:hypothetical protein
MDLDDCTGGIRLFTDQGCVDRFVRRATVLHMDPDAEHMFQVLNNCCSRFRYSMSNDRYEAIACDNELTAVNAVRTFLESGGNREATNSSGQTMLQVAVEGYCRILVGVLLAAGVHQAAVFRQLMESHSQKDRDMLNVFLGISSGEDGPSVERGRKRKIGTQINQNC